VTLARGVWALAFRKAALQVHGGTHRTVNSWSPLHVVHNSRKQLTGEGQLFRSEDIHK